MRLIAHILIRYCPVLSLVCRRHDDFGFSTTVEVVPVRLFTRMIECIISIFDNVGVFQYSFAEPAFRRQASTKNCVSILVVLIIYYACKPSCMLISSISFWSCPTLQYSNCGYKNICHAPTLSHGLCDPWSADLAFAWMLVNCIIFVLDQMYWIMCFRDRVCSGKDVAFAFILRRYIVLTGSQLLVLMSYGLSMNSSCTQDRMFKSTS